MHLICEHPGWQTTTAVCRRTVRTATDVWQALAKQTTITTARVGSGTDPAPVVDVYSPTDLSEHVPDTLRGALETQGPVGRLRNPDLWDALATAIIRQVIRADQARLMYHRFCDAYGGPVPEAGPSAFPRPETVLALDEDDFAGLGMAFKRRPLIAAAEAFIESGPKWAELPADVLMEEVQAVPRIGPWTAGAAVADVTGDFSRYPYGDMAVRKWAAQACPDIDWPTDEGTFARWWRSFAATPEQLSALTVLTLALGGPRGQDQPPS
jgi:DNA-3-methyladenine glycosylase II